MKFHKLEKWRFSPPSVSPHPPTNVVMWETLVWSLGGEHGNPLQYSCLENPVNRGAWWAMVHRVAKSETWPKRLRTAQHSTKYFVGASFFAHPSPWNLPTALVLFSSSKPLFLVTFLLFDCPKSQGIYGQGCRVSVGGKRNSFSCFITLPISLSLNVNNALYS